jgi:hypothetical protein
MTSLADMLVECDVEGEKKYGKTLADLRGEPPRPTIYELTQRIAELDGARVEEMAAKLWYLSCVEVLEAESPSGTVCYRWPDEIPPSWAERYRAKARAVLRGDAPKEDRG